MCLLDTTRSSSMNLPYFSGIELTHSMAASNSVENPSQLAFFWLKRLLDVVGCGTIIGFTVTQIGRFCVRGIGSRTDFSHISEMFEDTNMRSGLYPFFYIALLNDFGSLALCMSDRLFESVHCSTETPSLFVLVYPQSILWLLKSPITMWGVFLCPNAGSRNGSGGGLYMGSREWVHTTRSGTYNCGTVIINNIC